MDRRAALYARQSLDRTGEALAVTRQIVDCRKLAAARGWTVAEVYVDNDVSASNGKPRPQYRRLLDDLRAGRCNAIVAWAPDRLIRRPIELEELIDLVEQRKVALATVSSSDVDLTTPYGRGVARIFGAIARIEVEQKGARQARANRQRAEAGEARWTRRPYGYDKNGDRVVKVAGEVREIRKAAQRVLDGATLASVVRDLNRRDVATSTGARWTVSTLRRVLLNPRYAGIATYQGAHVGEGVWPAVLDEETHRGLVVVLTDPARRTAPTNERKYLLSGLVMCGKCGQPLYAAPVGRKPYWMAYRCHTNHLARRLELVDEVVEGAILERLSRPDAVELMAPPAPDLVPMLREAEQIRARLDELAELLAEGNLTANGVRKQSAKLRQRLDEIERVRLLQDRSPGLAPLVGAANVGKVWRKLSLERKREAIDILAEITILPCGRGKDFTPDQVRIDWRAYRVGGLE